MMKYSSYISRLIFLGFCVVLGLILGIYFDMGTKDRTLVGLVLLPLWLSMDWYLIRRENRKEEAE